MSHVGKVYLTKDVTGLTGVKGKVYQVYVVGQGEASTLEDLEALGIQLQEIEAKIPQTATEDMPLTHTFSPSKNFIQAGSVQFGNLGPNVATNSMIEFPHEMLNEEYYISLTVGDSGVGDVVATWFDKTTTGFSFGVRNLTDEQSTGVVVDWMVIGTAK